MQLCAETGLRVQGLVSAAADNANASERPVSSAGKTLSDKEFNPEVRAWLQRLRTLNSLWLSPDLYRTFSRSTPGDKRFERVESGCEACILAAVGGNVQAILDLRTSMIGRKKRGHESRLWGLVDAWTRRFGERAEWIRGESERVGRAVVKERRRVRRRRRKGRQERRLERKKGGTAKTESQGGAAAVGGGDGADDVDDEPEYTIGDVASRDGQGDREAEERDLEGSIIDYYRGLASESNLAVNVPQNLHSGHHGARVDEDALHPAFRDSVAYSPTSGTFHRRPQQPQHQQQQPSATARADDRAGAASRFTFYTQSAYSQDAALDSGFGGSSSHTPAQDTQPPTTINPFVNASSSRNARDRHVAEKRAESYQKLVGIPEEVPAPRSPSEATVREYMRGLWMPTPGAGAEDDGHDDGDEGRDARVEKSLADAYDRSRTDKETKEKHLMTWSDMMKKCGAKNGWGREEGEEAGKVDLTHCA